jgi:hypothetical protein
MSVRTESNIVHLEGVCGVAEAEPLLALLQAQPPQGGPAYALDLSGAEHLHAAIVQVLLAFRPPLHAPARDAFLQAWLLHGLAAHTPA